MYVLTYSQLTTHNLLLLLTYFLTYYGGGARAAAGRGALQRALRARPGQQVLA